MRTHCASPLAVVLAISTLVSFAACSKERHTPTAPAAPIVSIEDPSIVVQRFRTAWVTRDTSALDSCLAYTFGYDFACRDSAGQLFLDGGPDRDSTLLGAARLFRFGSASHPFATSIDVALDSLAITLDHHDPVHRSNAVCHADVTVRTSADTLRLGGHVAFALVRGDVFGITLPPDSTRWFLGACLEVAFHAAGSTKTGAAECDSLLTTTWSYALRRYLE